MAVRLTVEFFYVCDFNLSRELEKAHRKIKDVITAAQTDHILRVSAQGDDLPIRGYAEAAPSGDNAVKAHGVVRAHRCPTRYQPLRGGSLANRPDRPHRLMEKSG